MRQLTKVCITNGKNTNAHKLQYFQNTLKRQTMDWFIKYDTTNPRTTLVNTQQAFIEQFSVVQNEV